MWKHQVIHVSRINESCRTGRLLILHMWIWVMLHLWLWVISQMWVCVMLHIRENTRWATSHTYMRHRIRESFMSDWWKSHVAQINEPCRTCEWVMLHMWMSHVAHVNESCHTSKCLLSHIQKRRVANLNVSCLTYLNESYGAEHTNGLHAAVFD